MRYVCEDCGWVWYCTFPPDDDAECDNCGGELVEDDDVVQIKSLSIPI